MMEATPAEPMAVHGTRWFIRRHWMAFAALATGLVIAVAASVYVLWWFTGFAQSSGLVPASLGLWSLASLVGFILNLAFWELILVGVPVIVGVVIAWMWWKRLPQDEKTKWSWKSSRGSSGGAGFSFLLFIAFCIKAYLDGNWSVAISSFTVGYVVGSVITILAWVAAIMVIPAALAVFWWFSRKSRWDSP